MRFKLTPGKEYEDGKRYSKTKFLWFPKCAGNEIRWLETATYEYTYHEDMCGSWECGETWID